MRSSLDLFDSALGGIPFMKHQLQDTMKKELSELTIAFDESTIIAITDHTGKIEFVNKKFCDLSLYSEEELIGQNHRILKSGYHSNEFYRDMWRCIRSGKVWKGEILNKAKDGSFYWVHTTIVPFLDDKGKPYRYISIRVDITEQKAIEVKLQEALKNDFIQTVKSLENGMFKMIKDVNGNLIYTMAEGKLMERLGLYSEKLRNKTPFDIFPKDIASYKQAQYEKAYTGIRINYEIELSERLIYVDVSPILENEKVVELVGSVHDITEMRNTQKQLQENQILYQSLFEHSQDYVVTFYTNGKIVNMNPKVEALLGYSLDNIQNKSLKNTTLLETELGLHQLHFEKALEGESQTFEVQATQKNGENLYLSVTYLPIIIDKQIKGIFSIGKDITEEKKKQELNAYLAYHDELTKLSNRRGFEKKLREALETAKKTKQKLAVMYLDLDRFKRINDTLGHYIGDRLLEQVALRLKDGLTQGNSIARMGGDEFMVLCSEIISEECSVSYAQSLIDRLQAPFFIEGYELYVTVSIGISLFPNDGENVVDLMKHADIALYKAKDLGRNTLQTYSSSMNSRNYQSFILERDLRKALINQEFIVHFQPRVNGLTGKIVGAEALIRWNHPTLGLVSPAEFIPLAEETGLIIPIGQWVKRRVCEQLVIWKEQEIPIIPISINISAQRFLQKDFTENVRKILTEFNLEGNLLEIEITENSLIKNEEFVIQTLHELKELGIKIYIDDFGTGYSSFAYLKAFKIDGIKIDQLFVRNISCESENAGITSAMVKLAHHLNLDVIAEGVETIEELKFLCEHECTNVQGYLYSKPLCIEEFEAILRKGELKPLK
jgi:diguanylate cyclase (GGDEF)-like protein/PAS domain S-box-containing protein